MSSVEYRCHSVLPFVDKEYRCWIYLRARASAEVLDVSPVKLGRNCTNMLGIRAEFSYLSCLGIVTDLQGIHLNVVDHSHKSSGKTPAEMYARCAHLGNKLSCSYRKLSLVFMCI